MPGLASKARRESMKRFIDVTLGEANGAEVVTALENPLKAAPGDVVTWRLDAKSTNRQIRIQFVEVRLLSDEKLRGAAGPDGPFVSLVQDGAEIVGILPQEVALDRRFIYKFVVGENGEQVTWGNPIEGTENFGGLDIPQPPPRGG
jgi:hypothetical protein